MLPAETVFDALMDRAANEVTMKSVFGSLGEQRALLHEKLCGHGFSQIFLEIPLDGEAGFDLHIIHDAEDIRRGTYEENLYGNRGSLFAWYAGEPSCGDGLDVVYDLREDKEASPMVYLKMSDDTPDFDGFFRETGDGGAGRRFHALTKSLPSGWHPWYTGVHMRRKGKPLRIGSGLTDFAKRRYAGNPRFLADDLKALGFTARLSPMMIDKLRELFAFPWPVDVQLDLLDDGSVGDVLGISLCTGNMGRDALCASLEHGDLQELMLLLESYGVSDARWKKLGNTVFQVLALLHSDDGNKCRYILSGNLGFVKVRFQGTGALALDAKVYLNLRAVRFGKDDG